eukprot:Phypoly_transcript_13766.p1 GENE.Phypoly_transcript_13766~~Phypoly_transcript_13766.p1  ORF type:complete len:244 (+),score=20.87 Phypoly_transcript_13766:299-1030(+)
MKVNIGPHTLEQIPYDGGDIFLFTMNNGENAFNSTSVGYYNQMLDIVERSASPHTALVVTGSDKFWCTGLDLPLLKTLPSEGFTEAVNKFQLFLARFITLPCVTVAAINGHCFGGGAMWSLCHDYRVMRTDRGFWCIPAVDLGFRLTRGMASIFMTTLQPYPLVRDTVMTGKKFIASEAASVHIVDEALPQSEVVPRAIALAKEHCKKDKRAVGVVKSALHYPTVEALKEGIKGGIQSVFPNL